MANPGYTFTFHASVTDGIPAAFWSITEWKWIPDAGSPSVVCVNYGTPCYYRPSTSGVMQLTGVVNGATKTATVRVILQCVTTGPTGDSAFLGLPTTHGSRSYPSSSDHVTAISGSIVSLTVQYRVTASSIARIVCV